MPNDPQAPGLFDVAEFTPPNPRPRVSDDDPGPPSPPVPPYADVAASVRSASTHPLLPPHEGDRDGATYDADLDRHRLNGQHLRIARVMADHQWHTLAALSAATGDPQASISARLRDLRKPAYGSRVIDRRRTGAGRAAQHEYRMDPDKRTPPSTPDPTLRHAVQIAAEVAEWGSDQNDSPYTHPLVVLICRHCAWRYELPEGSTVHDAMDALARHPREDADQ